MKLNRASCCPCCGKLLDAATVAGAHEVRPEPGSITICLYCGHLMAFGDGLVLRELTGKEMHEVAGHPDILLIQRLRGQVMKGEQ